jgi:DNA (cytosine-5)-methyltransferase 1
VPQRRRRIYVVADLNGGCAGEVLFKPESLRGDSAASNETGEEVAADALGRAGRGVGNEPGYGSGVIALQANGIDRADTAGCNGAGWRDDQMYTLNTIDRHAVVYPDTFHTLTALNARCVESAQTPNCVVEPYQRLIGALCSTDYKWVQQQQVEQNKLIVTAIEDVLPKLASGKPVVSTLLHSCSEKMWLGDQEAFSGNYHILGKGTPPRHYVVRRLHPIECARLQGFPDWWGELSEFDGDIVFWEDVRKTLAAIAGTAYKPSKNLKKWYNGLHTDASEYKMWGNGIALPFAVYVAKNIAECTMKA